jgi:hypothetical protein
MNPQDAQYLHSTVRSDAFTQIVRAFELDGWHRTDSGTDYAMLEYHDRTIGFSRRNTMKVIGNIKVVLGSDGKYVVQMPHSNPFSTGAAAYRSFRQTIKHLQKIGLLSRDQKRI